MNTEESSDLAREFINRELKNERWYQNIQKDIKAIVFYGSRAKGANREDSDIDLLIILPLEIETRFTKGEYSINFKGFEINIVMRSIEKLRLIDFDKDEFQKEIFRNCKILSEKDSEVRNLIYH